MSRKKVEAINETEWVTAMFGKQMGKPPGWFTIPEMAQMIGRSEGQLRKIVRAEVAAGKLEQMDCIINGKATRCYRPKK